MVDENGNKYYQFRRAFRIREPSKGERAHRLVFLRKTGGMSGTEVLDKAERFVVDRLKGDRLELQDASFVECNDDAATFDLGFRSLLEHGKTWYERRGYKVHGPGASTLRRRVATAIAEFKRFPLARLVVAIHAQLDALRTSSNVSWTIRHDLQTAADLELEPGPSRLTVVRNRAKVLDMIESLPSASSPTTLGPWLVGLSCKDYAAFLDAMYGPKMGKLDRKSFAISDIAGIKTPTLNIFKRANGLRRQSHRLSWIKVFHATIHPSYVIQ